MSMPWLRLYTEFASDPVMQSLAFEDQRHFIILLCLKGNGTLDRPMKPAARDRIIYRGLGLDPNSAEEAKRRMMESEIIDAKWQPKAWDKRQFTRDHSTERVRKYRKNNETGNANSELQKRDCNSIVTPPDTDTDTEQNRTEQPTAALRPTVVGAKRRPATRKTQFPDDFNLTDQRVESYRTVMPAGNLVADWDQFRDHHVAKGSVMADWDAAWRTWSRNAAKFGEKGNGNGTHQQNHRETAADRVYRLNKTEPDPDIDRYL